MSNIDPNFAAFDNDLEDLQAATAEAATSSMLGQLFEAGQAKQFMTAGNATVTLKSKKSGDRFTYKIKSSNDGNVFFVGLMDGPDNENSYSYMGIIKRGFAGDMFNWTRKSRITRDAPSYKAFNWAWTHLSRGTVPAQLEIWHEGSCGRCGRKLTVPESVASGFGPECIKKVGG